MEQAKQHPIWKLTERIDDALGAIERADVLDFAQDYASAAKWHTAEIRGHVARLTAEAQLTQSPGETQALREALVEADARILHLEAAMTGVIEAYGDNGWARSEMCRRLRAALAHSLGDAQEIAK